MQFRSITLPLIPTKPTNFSILTLLILGVLMLLQPAGATLPEPTHAANFRLNDHQDRSHELYRLRDHEAVVLFTHGIACPIVRLNVTRLNALQEAYADKDVAFLMLNANPQDSRADIREEAEDFDIRMPILKDESQMVSRGLGIERTAEALLLAPGDNWRIVYRGPIDDRLDYGAQRPEANEEWLKEALDAHLAGEAIDVDRVAPRGCLITYETPDDIDYVRDIVPILQNKCLSCHAPGGAAPFALNGHQRIQGWSAMIREVIQTRRMPPWHADPDYGEFRHDRGLSATEETTLLHWLDEGAPWDGEEPDPLRETPRIEESDWLLGAPDLEVQLPELQELDAEGIFAYRYFHVPSGLEEDRWVRAIDVKPTNQAVVHHALIFVLYPLEYQHVQPDMQGGLDGYFAAYVPGSPVEPFPEDMGMFLPAGSVFVFQMHYNATGRPETDQTQMGLYFHDKAPAKSLHIRGAAETSLNIPPHSQDHEVTAQFTFDQDVQLLGLSPHMHYRGSRFRFTLDRPDAAPNTLLNVPFYEFDWQPLYTFEEPLGVPAGSVMHCVGAFDNSIYNPRNPDPDSTVRFGEQSFDEMFIGYIQYAQDIDSASFAPKIPEALNAALAQLDPPYTVDVPADLPGTHWQLRDNLLSFEADGGLLLNGAGRGNWTKLNDRMIMVQAHRLNMPLFFYDGHLVSHRGPLQALTAAAVAQRLSEMQEAE